jgi:hypothetical protein
MHINHTFATFSAFLQHATTAKSHLSTDQRSSRTESSYRTAFTGTATFGEAVQLAEGGWTEGLARIAALSSVIYTQVNDRVLRDELAYDVVGDAWDMGRVLTGEPECAMRWEQAEVPITATGKVVRIVVNASASWEVSADVLFTRGAAICALVDALESAGRRCEVTVATATTGGSDNTHHMEMRVLVKHAADALQPEALAFALCHASMLRRLVFSIKECSPRSVLKSFNIKVGGGYGAPAEVRGERGDLYLPAARANDSQWASVASAREWVLRELEQQGVTLTAA